MFACWIINTQKNTISYGFAMNYNNQAISIINICIYHIYIIINPLKSTQIIQKASQNLKISKGQSIWVYLCLNICTYHMTLMHYFAVQKRVLCARINIIHRLKYTYIYNIRNLKSNLSLNFMDKTLTNKVFGHFNNLRSCIYCVTKHRIMTINDLHFFTKMLLSWDIHHTGKGRRDRTNL
eukprot:UN02515